MSLKYEKLVQSLQYSVLVLIKTSGGSSAPIMSTDRPLRPEQQ